MKGVASDERQEMMRVERKSLRPGRILTLLTGVGLLGLAIWISWPLPGELLSRDALHSVRLTDREGNLLRELRSSLDGRSIPLPGGEIPPLVRAAILAAEDRRFDSHPGVDPLAMARALEQNLRNGRVVSGASTLTQQLARQLRPHARNLVGKLAEAAWALRLEAQLDKDTLLLEYLNRVPLGNSLFGIEAAAEFYFARPARSLSLGQAALLAGMACAPARLDPFRHESAARARMGRVLEALVDLGGITEDEARLAREAPLDLTDRRRAFGAPHLMAELVGSLSARGLDRAVRIETTLDPALQSDVEALVEAELSGLAERRVGQAAVLVVDNTSGDVLAYVGSRDFLDEVMGGQNDGVRALRQPGSALKPFAYGLALASGMTPATVLSDVEVHLATPGGDYVPRNYDRRVHGPVRLRAALANSYNIPAVRVAESLGPLKLLQTLRLAGFESLREEAAHYGVGLVLGNGDTSLRELARAYRGLALGGVVGPLREIRAALDADGRPLPLREELPVRRFLPADAVGLLTDILADERARAPAFGLDNALRLPFPTAVKTGTSRAHVDNWTIGFTRARTVAVWVGNFDGTPMKGVSGITGAGPLFKRVMIRAMERVPSGPLVERELFERVDVCPLSGERRSAACPGVVHEIFLPGTAPAAACRMHRTSRIDPRTGVPLPCGSRQGVTRTVVDVGPGFYAWAQAEGLQAAGWVAEDCDAPGGELISPRLLLPGDGDKYLLDAGLPLSAQFIPVRVVAPAGVKRLELRFGDGRVESLLPPFSRSLEPVRGSHRVELWVPGETAPVAVARYQVR